MNNWKEFVFLKVQNGQKKINIIKDSDRLFNDQDLISYFQEKDFELLFFKNTIDLRFDYEKQYRKLLSESLRKLIIIVNTQEIECEELPYDFTRDAQILNINLLDLFPFLNGFALKMIDHTLLKKLFPFSSFENDIDKLDISNSIKYILKYGYQIDLEVISDTSDLLKMLFEIHYSNLEIVDEIKSFMVDFFIQKNQFSDWPLNALLFDKKNFFEFLQERWPRFLDNYFSEKIENVREEKVCYQTETLKYSGPELLPFEDKRLNVYIPQFFYEELLQPVPLNKTVEIKENWINPGILSENSDIDQIKHFKEKILNELPKPNAINKDWITLAFDWSKLLYLFHRSENLQFNSDIDAVRAQIDQAFLEWLQSSYSLLSTISPIEPVMNHQIVKKLNRDLQSQISKKIALIVIDGLSLEQWFILKNQVFNGKKKVKIEEKAVFSWIPTLTSISRQAIFSGKMPLQFSESISTTAKEKRLWTEFWEAQRYSRNEIVYEKFSGDESINSIKKNTLFENKKKIIGIVINKVDDIMHGMQNGSLGMKSQIELWSRNSFLKDLISMLLERHYAIWITSDHGNIECHGNGTINEGSLIQTKGQRVRIYKDKAFKKQLSQSNLYVHEWKPNGLPDDFYPVFAGGTTAFVKENKKIVTHGGISVEEVIVPFVKIERIKEYDE